jgi:hypothetical protein
MWRAGDVPAGSAAELSGAGGAANKSSLDMNATYQLSQGSTKAK